MLGSFVVPASKQNKRFEFMKFRLDMSIRNQLLFFFLVVLDLVKRKRWATRRASWMQTMGLLKSKIVVVQKFVLWAQKTYAHHNNDTSINCGILLWQIILLDVSFSLHVPIVWFEMGEMGAKCLFFCWDSAFFVGEAIRPTATRSIQYVSNKGNIWTFFGYKR